MYNRNEMFFLRFHYTYFIRNMLIARVNFIHKTKCSIFRQIGKIEQNNREKKPKNLKQLEKKILKINIRKQNQKFFDRRQTNSEMKKETPINFVCKFFVVLTINLMERSQKQL